jgi:hypothetical protein
LLFLASQASTDFARKSFDTIVLEKTEDLCKDFYYFPSDIATKVSYEYFMILLSVRFLFNEAHKNRKPMKSEDFIYFVSLLQS